MERDTDPIDKYPILGTDKKLFFKHLCTFSVQPTVLLVAILGYGRFELDITM